MAEGLLSAGPPPLTEVAADSAIDVIDFMAAAVRGVDTIDVTPAGREAWCQQELYNHSVSLQLLTNMSTIGANNTIGLMHAYSGMS